MKKLFLLMIAGLMIFASCKKDKNPQYPFDHLQWITEEMDGCDLSNYGIDDCARLPEGRLLMDVGATKEDKGYLAWVVTSSDECYSSGDIVLIDEDSYGYNPETGSFSFPGFDDAMVSFISETKVKVDYDGTATIFELATKNYKVKNAIDPLPAGPTAFTLTPEKTSEWAGGSVQINANREVVTWSFEVKGHPVDGAPYQNGSLATSISDNGLLTLAMYKKRLAGSVYSITDAVIVVTAKTADGQTATCNVTSKAWKLVVYDDQIANGSPLTPEEIRSGDAIAFGPHSANGKIIEDWEDSGFVWKHNCLDTYSDINVYVIADVLYSGQIGEEWGIIDNYSPYYISFTYGEYEDKMIIPDDNLH